MLLARLRQETKRLHRRIEASLNLLRSDFSLNDYRWLPGRFFGYYCAWKEFGETLEARPLREHEEIIFSAAGAFESIEQWAAVPCL